MQFSLIWSGLIWHEVSWCEKRDLKTDIGYNASDYQQPLLLCSWVFLPSWTNMICILLITTWYPRKYIDFPGSMRKSCNTSKSYKIHFCQLKCTAACQNAYSDQVFASLSMLYLQICTAVAFCICICTTSTKVPGCICRRAPSDSHVAFFLWNFAPQALVHVFLVFSTLEWSRWGV